jgi:hypothetical protein
MVNPERPVASELDYIAAYTEDAFRPGGVLAECVRGALPTEGQLSPNDVADAVFPPRNPTDEYKARWELLGLVPDAVRTNVQAAEANIFDHATRLGMRKNESISEEDLRKIILGNATWIVEGGANRTSVVRRALAVDTLKELYGEAASDQVIFQFGSDRKISPLRKDDSVNPEYKAAREIAGDFLPEGELTEHGLNVASALRSGYTVVGEQEIPGGYAVHVKKEGAPGLVLVQPKKIKRGLTDAFSALNNIGFMEGRQPVIFTNGHYRPKDVVQATLWADDNDVDIFPAVAIGDEQGYSCEHNGKMIVTGERKAAAYANEMVVLERLTRKLKRAGN